MGEPSFVERRHSWNASLRDHFRELEERWNRANVPLAVIHLPTRIDANARPDDLDRSAFPAEILRTLETHRPNLLLIGSPSHLPPVLRILEGSAVPPVVSCGAPRFALAERAIGTLVIHGANRLNEHQQRQLHNWLPRHPLTQVILTTSEPLIPLVLRNAFDADLFFQLNVKSVSVVMADASPEAV